MPNKRKEFSKIYDKYIDKIYRFIFLKVNSEEVAQDLCSETFLRGWASYKSRDDIENCQAFLYKIARNLLVDHYRERDRTNLVSTENTAIIDPVQDIREKIALNSDLDQVKAVLLNLNEDYQNVIVWHYMEDLSVPEIAKMLDKSESTTRVILHRALKSLKNGISRTA